MPQRYPKRPKRQAVNGENPLTTRANGFRFYKLSKRNESKVRRLPASELYEGEIVVYQLSELKYKGKMWINYDEKIKEEGKI